MGTPGGRRIRGRTYRVTLSDEAVTSKEGPMIGRTTEPSHGYERTEVVDRDRYAVEPRARGGIAAGPILTGVMVAFGSMSLLLAVVGGILVALGLADGNLTGGEAIEAGIGAGIALV